MVLLQDKHHFGGHVKSALPWSDIQVPRDLEFFRVTTVVPPVTWRCSAASQVPQGPSSMCQMCGDARGSRGCWKLKSWLVWFPMVEKINSWRGTWLVRSGRLGVIVTYLLRVTGSTILHCFWKNMPCHVFCLFSFKANVLSLENAILKRSGVTASDYGYLGQVLGFSWTLSWRAIWVASWGPTLGIAYKQCKRSTPSRRRVISIQSFCHWEHPRTMSQQSSRRSAYFLSPLEIIQTHFCLLLRLG